MKIGGKTYPFWTVKRAGKIKSYSVLCRIVGLNDGFYDIDRQIITGFSVSVRTGLIKKYVSKKTVMTMAYYDPTEISDKLKQFIIEGIFI